MLGTARSSWRLLQFLRTSARSYRTRIGPPQAQRLIGFPASYVSEHRLQTSSEGLPMLCPSYRSGATASTSAAFNFLAIGSRNAAKNCDRIASNGTIVFEERRAISLESGRTRRHRQARGRDQEATSGVSDLFSSRYGKDSSIA